jgi:hypothetical protein
MWIAILPCQYLDDVRAMHVTTVICDAKPVYETNPKLPKFIHIRASNRLSLVFECSLQTNLNAVTPSIVMA